MPFLCNYVQRKNIVEETSSSIEGRLPECILEFYDAISVNEVSKLPDIYYYPINVFLVKVRLFSCMKSNHADNLFNIKGVGFNMKYSIRIIIPVTIMLILALSACLSSNSGSQMTAEPSIAHSGNGEKMTAQGAEQNQSQNFEAAVTVQTEPLTSKETAEKPIHSAEPTEFALEETSLNSMAQNAISYVGMDGFFVPLSWVVEGYQLLSGDIGPVSAASEKLLGEAPPAESLRQIEAPEGSALGPIASNGTWDFFPDVAQYHTYGPDRQPDQQEWTDYFEEKLAVLGYDGPVLIRQAVRFQGASSEVAVVTASNITTNGVQAFLEGASICQAEKPANKEPGLYILTALFVQGQEPLEVYHQYEEISPFVGADYLPWNRDTSFMQAFSAFQFDNEGNMTAYPIYMDMTGEAQLRIMETQPAFLIADINGDSSSEVIACISAPNSLMSWCKVFTFTSGFAEEYLHISLN